MGKHDLSSRYASGYIRQCSGKLKHKLDDAMVSDGVKYDIH